MPAWRRPCPYANTRAQRDWRNLGAGLVESACPWRLFMLECGRGVENHTREDTATVARHQKGLNDADHYP
jgi:hypothetical protein